MADFDLTQTDAQVQSILNDAQDAQGAGAQTTLTTDYIMLKDTSGNYHKILKDSFTEACRNVLAGLLVNNDKGTTISQIPAIASGDFGSVTPANLASVLGGFNIGFTRKPLQAEKTLLFTANSAEPFVIVIRDTGLSGVAFGIGYSSNANVSVVTDLNNNLHNMLSIEGYNVYVTPESARPNFSYKWFYL